ncbi:MAG TPA: M1 family metallopeptidase [Cyclobacteriaceae bacterium]|nr:M1 family metallopeptidase [Cyclobacteriaceae bacterium]
MKQLLLFFSLSLVIFSLSAQELYMPRDIKEAYRKGTRSLDGKPGKNYWQNHGSYNITVTALPPDRNVKGEESITYFNNSPDSIRNPVIKLFLNIHKPGAPRNFGATEDYLTSGMKIDEVTFNGAPYVWKENPNRFTWYPMPLPKPLAPHDSMKLTFKWHYEISKQSNREGMIDSLTYFLAYFYPRIAVLDDYNVWDRMNFMDSHEFYSDFNDYVVTVNVPKNYVVWGTGTLQHPESVLQPDILKRFNESFSSNQTIQVATKEELAAGKVTTQKAINSWQFTAKNIPDMTFGISDHYLWDAGSVVVDDATKRRASVQAAYLDKAADYRYMVKFGKHSLNWLSRNWPGIPYPYEKTTIFQGFAGMEYPMMANDESYSDTTFSRFVAEHEIAHTYMPFYMGTNETRYGFMDEGWATTFELLIGRADMGVEKAEAMYKQFRVEGWIGDRSSNEDIPIITPGDALTGAGFGNNEYGKASIGYFAMKDLLGDELFKKCLHAYMDRWHGKHPTPWDFFYTFNNVSGKNLNWFWNRWFFETNYIDLSISNIKQSGSGFTANIDNIGGMPAPFDLVTTFADGSTERFHQTPAVWQTDVKKTSITIKTKKKIKSVSIDGGIWMDADGTNNDWTSK